MKELLRRVIAWHDRHPKVVFALLGVGVIWPVLALASPWYQLALRSDESLPDYRLFLIQKGREPQRGELVAFVMAQASADRVQPAGPARPYTRVGVLWTKRLVGVPGDQVEVRGRQVLVNGAVVGEGLERDRLGIPPGQYYLALPHPRSFDSRYYGYVRAEDLRGVVTPIW
jgi:conjugal transfer pilin signal peptidase TrbI